MDHLQLGRAGEEYAVFWLTGHHIEILERNWRCGRLEVDIVARDGKTVVFVEVKTRSSEWYDKPEDAVNASKQKAMLKAASVWCRENNHNGPVRFDIISVTFGRGSKKLLHYKDAFYPVGETD